MATGIDWAKAPADTTFIPDAVMDDGRLSRFGKIAYMSLASFSLRGGDCSPSQQEIATRAKVSRVTAMRGLAELEERGHIRRVRVAGDRATYVLLSGGGTTNVWPVRIRQTTELEKKRAEFKRVKEQWSLDLLAAAECRCQGCGSQESLCIDHIVPLARGGTNEKSNLQVLCRGCNGSKGAR